MKKTLSIIFLLVLSSSVKSFAQQLFLTNLNDDLLTKYIQSAKENYAKRKISDKRVDLANTAKPLAFLPYLDMVNASYFYRPNSSPVITTPGTVNANPYSVNGIQFGISASLGQIISRPFLMKQAKINADIAKLELEDFDKSLELEVKSRYYDYIQNLAQLKLNTDNLQKTQIAADAIRAKFEKGDILLDVYDQSLTALSASKSIQLSTEISFLKAKDILENLIGKKLSEIK
ncbi:MAG: TolC family protein [Bacteroidota bacterium]